MIGRLVKYFRKRHMLKKYTHVSRIDKKFSSLNFYFDVDNIDHENFAKNIKFMVYGIGIIESTIEMFSDVNKRKYNPNFVDNINVVLCDEMSVVKIVDGSWYIFVNDDELAMANGYRLLADCYLTIFAAQNGLSNDENNKLIACARKTERVKDEDIDKDVNPKQL